MSGDKSTTTTVPREILQWSLDRPAWQRDALRRLFTAGIGSEDIAELTDLCKAAHGLAEPKPSQPLTDENIAATGASQTTAVSLTSITHHHGVNALAPEQTINFGPNLTIVFGQNATGKSGFTRILKRSCRARGTEQILGDVLSGETPTSPSATIRFKAGKVDDAYSFAPHVAASDFLSAVSVFDAQSAAVYLREKTDVAFRPFGLDIFDKLSTVCNEIRGRLEQEQKQLASLSTVASIPITPGTRARSFIDSLSAVTKEEDAKALVTLTASEEARVTELRKKLEDSKAGDPENRAKELRLKADRLQVLERHIESVAGCLSDASIARIRAATDTLRAADRVAQVIRSAAFTTDVLDGTGDKAWFDMWHAASVFSNVAYPQAVFPNTSESARCPLCQQPLDLDTRERLRHFAEYVTSQAQGDLLHAEREYREACGVICNVTIEKPDINLAIEDLNQEDALAADATRKWLADGVQIQAEIRAACQAKEQIPEVTMAASPRDKVVAAIATLRNRADNLTRNAAGLTAEEATHIKEFEARASLKSFLPIILDEIERKRRLAAYRQCVDDTSTQAITRKSTDLTKTLVTEQLRGTFKDELKQLGFTHLLVDIEPAGGTKGALYHRITFSNAPGVVVTEVLSEGESRSLSLAAFLTELSTASARSAIIFDDPVSSLDHIWRDRIAKRLVAESSVRQVIVFTHDVLFLRLLMDQADKRGTGYVLQCLRRDGQPGLTTPELPWATMPVKARIGYLRNKLQAVEKIFLTGPRDEYELQARFIYGLLREAWEQAVVEVLLNDVVEPYRPSIETQRIRDLHDITAADCKAVDDGMTECSRWIIGHTQAAADGTPVPNPGDVSTRIDELDAWVKSVRKRR